MRFLKILGSFALLMSTPVLLADSATQEAGNSGIAPAPLRIGLYAYNRGSWNASVARQFPLIVYQLGPTDPLDRAAGEISSIAADGGRIIVDFEFMTTNGQREGKAPLPAQAQVQARLFALLDRLDHVPLEGVSLDEENLLSADRSDYLSRLYRAAKKRYPDRPFFQWVWLGKRPVAMARLAALPADGWIIDPYQSTSQGYATLVGEMKSISPRIYSVVWASPSWNVEAGHRIQAAPGWWNERRWKLFYDSLVTNQREGVPTILYLFGLNDGRVSTLWSGADCDRRFFQKLVTVTVPYVEAHTLSPVTPSQIPQWMPGHCG
jgi:hypothetical protein